MMEEYVKAHEKLLRCWNCKRVIDVTVCQRCLHEAETCICPYCGKCLCDNPKFKDNTIDSEVIKEADGSWHVGPYLQINNRQEFGEKK
jgi:DTW domain-containing protein YfiP